MPTLLHLDSSMRTESSRSRALSAHFADAWLKANPGGKVIYRDLAADPVPHLDQTAFTANFVDAADRAIPEGWSRFVEVRGGEDATNIYIGAVDRDMPLLIATWDGDGVLVTVKASLKDLSKAPMAWAHSHDHPED